MSTLISRLVALFRRSAAEHDLRDELDFHVEMETRKNLLDGVSPAEARRRALVAFGGVETHKETLRDRRTFRWVEDVVVDTRYALRWLARSRGFTVVAVVTLAAGLGAITATFTVVNAVLLRPLPYRDADELAVIYSRNPERGYNGANISYEDYLSWKSGVSAFERLGIFQWNSNTISGSDAQAERVEGAEVDADLFAVLGVEPLLGRGVRAEEQVAGRDRVVIIGYGLWQRRYGGDRGVIGRTITVNGNPHVIVGVMPAGFQFPYSGEVWRPMVPDEDYVPRGNRFLAGAVGRLRDGVDRAAAEAELLSVSQRLQREYPESNTGWEAEYVPIREDIAGSSLRAAMLVVFAAAGLVVLIVCGNLAGLLLARSASRGRELALRASIGAGRGRLLRQLLTETLVLTVAGGAGGLIVAHAGVRLLRTALADRIPSFIAITPDLRVYGFGAALTVLMALLAGVAPAFQGMRVDGHALVKDGARTTIGRRGARSRSALVVGEVALAVVLLIGSVLLVKTMGALTRIDPGFDARNVLTARYNLPSARYDGPERRAAFQSALIERLRALPGVVGVGAAQGTPFSGWNVGGSYEVEGEPAPPPGSGPVAHVQAVTPTYFDVLGVPLLRGRMVADTDRDQGNPVAVVNESFIARHFAGEDPIGRRFRFGAEQPWITIVGVVADYRHYRLTESMSAAAFLPYARQVPPQMTLAIRTAGPAALMIPTLRRVLAELDPDIPAFRVQTLEEVVARQTWVQRIARDILAAFAATAALLSVVGLYGLISYSVARRSHELGVRLALGAAPRRLLRRVVAEGLRLALLGIAIGSVAALVASGTIETLLFGVEPADRATFIFVPLLVAALTTLASFIPARRAAATDPMVTLRTE